jgi:hypothetical protein
MEPTRRPPGRVHDQGIVVGREGVMEMWDGSNIPRVTCRGARQKSALVVNEVRDNQGDHHRPNYPWNPGRLSYSFSCLARARQGTDEEGRSRREDPCPHRGLQIDAQVLEWILRPPRWRRDDGSRRL